MSYWDPMNDPKKWKLSGSYFYGRTSGLNGPNGKGVFKYSDDTNLFEGTVTPVMTPVIESNPPKVDYTGRRIVEGGILIGWHLCGVFYHKDGTIRAEGTYRSWMEESAPDGTLFLSPLVPALYYSHFPDKIIVHKHHALDEGGKDKTCIFRVIDNATKGDILNLDLLSSPGAEAKDRDIEEKTRD